MSKLIIEDINIDLLQKNIKNIYISVHPPDGRVRMSAPKTMNYESIKLFAISKIDWIKKQRKKFKNQERLPSIEFVSGEIHYLFGERYILNLIEIKYKQRVDIEGEYLNLYATANSTKEKREKILDEWYRVKLKQEIPSLIEKWEKIMNVSVAEWNVKKMKTRWGTCNIQVKRIWINLELAKKNPRCLEYIVVHEMVHLLERNHNDKFKKYMSKFLPNWKDLKNEINSMS